MSEKLCKTCREADGGPHICNNDKIDIILFEERNSDLTEDKS